MPRLRLLLAGGVLVTATLGACSDDEGAAPATTAGGPTSAPVTTAREPSTTSTTEAETTTTSPAAADLVLRGDGLGIVELGADPETAVAAVTDALGDPTADTGWASSFSAYGTCPGTEVRGVQWDHLVLLFTDEATEHGEGRHLFAWRVTGSPPAVGTATGFGYRATAADAEELYPGAVEVVPADEPFPAFLRITADGGTITAYLDEAEVVTNLEAGTPCGE